MLYLKHMKLLDLGDHQLLEVNINSQKSPKTEHLPAITIKSYIA